MTRFAGGVALVGLLAITYYTLFPFDIVAGGESISGAIARFRVETGPVLKWRAMPSNVALFLPFGFGLGGVVRRWTRSRVATIVACGAVGLAVSAGIEFTQARWLVRDPSLDDIVANTAGAALGGLLWHWSEPAVSGRIGRGIVPDAAVPRRLLMAAALLPAIVVLALTAATRDATAELDWQPGNWLVLGNEVTGDRAWSGTIAEISVSDRRLTGSETEQWLRGAPMSELAGEHTLVDLRFAEATSAPPGWEVLPDPLDSDRVLGGGELHLGPDGWLQTTEPADELAESVARSGSFTVAIDASSATVAQDGPARIVSLSIDPFRRDLTVGQEGSDLVVRVRSTFTGTNGDDPEYAVRNFFGESLSHRMVISYDASSIRVATTGDAGGTIELQPATVPMVETFPDHLVRLHVSAIGDVTRNAYLALFAIGPWCVAVALLRARRRFDLSAALLVLALVVAFELTLAAILPVHQVRVTHLAVVGVGALLLTWGLTALGGGRRSARRPAPPPA